MKILLTGCAGFIGWNTALSFLDTGHEVVGIDDLNDYYDTRLKKWRLDRLTSCSSFTFKKGDIRDRDFLKKVFSDTCPDAVVNLAARAGVHASIANPSIYFETNVLGNLHLLELCRHHHIQKYLLASTSSLYAGEKMPFSESLPVNRPISPYAASKKGAEATCYTYHSLFHIDITVLRYFTVYGPAGRPDLSIFKFIKMIDKGETLTVYSDGEQSRDFTYISDIAEGTRLATLTHTGFEIINLGGNQPHTLNYAIALIEEFLGKKATIVHKPMLPTDINATWADIGKAENLLGWKPHVCFREGIQRTVAWYLEHRNFLTTLQFPL
ncbi:MAG: GDP-mannose 4,6-dehydratase [Candidatus Ratteibacteria bacterium]